MEPSAGTALAGSGQSLPRIEGTRLVRGEGRYAGDLHRSGELHLVFVRSPHAHADIVGLDAAAARRLPGVAAVYAGADLQRAGVQPLPLAGEGFTRPDGSAAASPVRWALAQGRVRHVGEAVAAVVADSAAQALAAVAAIAVDYRPLPAVVDPELAMRPGAPSLCDAAPDNLAAQARHGDADATALAFAAAAHRVTLDLLNQRLAPCALEPRALLVDVAADSGRLTLYASTQMATALKAALADVVPGLGGDALRVVVGDVGGGFGMKTVLFPEDVVACFAAQQLRRPVRWCSERSEEFSSALHGRDLRSLAELALDAQGRVLALRVRALANVGAYATAMGVAIPLVVGPVVVTSVYDIPTVDLQFDAMLTNTAPTGAYRGAGQPEMIHIVERLMDAAARRLDMDPAVLRRLNMVRPAQMPYRNAMAQVYDSGCFADVLDRALLLADWDGFAQRRQAALQRGRLLGRGIGSCIKWTGAYQLEEQAGIKVQGDGRIEILSAAQEMGQGITTACAQLVVDVLELPIACMQVVQGDTDRVNGFGSGGSRSLFTGGAAVQAAARLVIDEARVRAAAMLEVAATDLHYERGRLQVAGTDLGIGLFEVAAAAPGHSFAVAATSQASGPSWPNACHVCEVEIDPLTGAVQVLRHVSVNDIGRVVNPALARGQIEGALVQGLGQALTEAVAYDRSTGQLLSASFMDYALPRADQVPTLVTEFFEGAPCRSNALGAKGAGELGLFGAVPALSNAVIDALAQAGVQQADRLQMPHAAEQVWLALQPCTHRDRGDCVA